MVNNFNTNDITVFKINGFHPYFLLAQILKIAFLWAHMMVIVL